MEYCKLKHEMNDLKQYVQLPKNRSNLEFDLLMKDSFVDSSLRYRIYRSDPVHTFLKFVDHVVDFNNYDDDVSKSPFYRIIKKNDNYSFEYLYDKDIIITNQEKFNNRVDSLLSSSFAKNASFSYENDEFKLAVYLGTAYVKSNDDEYLWYDITQDKYHLEVSEESNKDVSNISLTDMLSYRIPKEDLSDYYKEIIENNKVLRKVI